MHLLHRSHHNGDGNDIDSHDAELKQLWTYLFHLWEIPLDGTAAFSRQDKTRSHAGSTQKDSSTVSPDWTPLSNLYSLQRPIEPVTEPKYAAEPDNHGTPHETVPEYQVGMLHPLLKPLDPKKSLRLFWETLKTDYPDDNLLRYLKARSWNVDQAAAMLTHDWAWKSSPQYNTTEIIHGGERAIYAKHQKGVIRNLELQKAVIIGRDRKQRPVLVVRAKLHTPGEQTAEEIEKFAVLVIEQIKLFYNTRMSAATIIFDLSKFSMANMEYEPVKFLISCLENHYPECLAQLFVHKAPWLFNPIWNIVKPWLDAEVVSKIHFTKSHKDLLKYIDDSCIPDYLGGKCKVDWDNYHVPDGTYDKYLHDHATKSKIVSEFIELIKIFTAKTVQWIECRDAKLSKQLKLQRIDIERQIRLNYSKLDPYVRSRSVYDINGLLKV